MSRDIERGSRSIQSLLNYTIYNILPTLVEIVLVIVLLSSKFDVWFAVITFGALVALHRLHGDGHRVAHALPARDERAGLEGQHARRSTR